MECATDSRSYWGQAVSQAPATVRATDHSDGLRSARWKRIALARTDGYVDQDGQMPTKVTHMPITFPIPDGGAGMAGTGGEGHFGQ